MSLKKKYPDICVQALFHDFIMNVGEGRKRERRRKGFV